MTTAERAKELKQRPAYILAATQSTATDGESMTSHHRPRISRLPEAWYAGQELWRVSGVTPKDMPSVFRKLYIDIETFSYKNPDLATANDDIRMPQEVLNKKNNSTAGITAIMFPKVGFRS